MTAPARKVSKRQGPRDGGSRNSQTTRLSSASIATLPPSASSKGVRLTAKRYNVENGEHCGDIVHACSCTCTPAKRSGGSRLVEIPKGRLREAQRRILHGLLDRIAPHGAVHGFRKGHGIVSFAAPHADREVVVRFDLADFFVSIRAARVHALFVTLGYPAEVARTLTGLCTNRVPSARLLAPDLRDRFDWIGRQRYRERHLPHGAPTSPARK